MLSVACLLHLGSQPLGRLHKPFSVDAEAGFRAVGVFMCWLGLIKYLQFNVEFYMLILSIKASVVRIARFIITVAFVFSAFLFSGLLLFSQATEVIIIMPFFILIAIVHLF